DFIEAHNLTWIDGLGTGSGADLGDPEHRQHNAAYVQDYIRKFGKRKVEANALVARPEAGRQLCRAAILKYLDRDAVARYQQELACQQELARAALPAALRRALARLDGAG